MKVDVIVCTYKSEKYLEQCLTSIEKYIPLNELIVVDHHSPDRTIEIAKKHNATIYYEEYSLGNARQVGIDNSETPIFIFVDSDVVFYDGKWFPKAISMVGEKTRVGGLTLWTPTTLAPWRRRYVDYWWKNLPDPNKKLGFVNAYLIYRKAIEGIRIPRYLGAFDNVFMKNYMEKRGWKIGVLDVNGMHFYDFPEDKAAWLGAGSRTLDGLRFLHPVFFTRKILLAPFKALPPAIAYNDPKIIISNTRYWLKFLSGWLHPKNYLVLKR
jgi:glycosyltransferase involved in cell wall biosynthesis